MPWAKRYAFAVALSILSSVGTPAMVCAQDSESGSGAAALSAEGGSAPGTGTVPSAAMGEALASTDEATRKEAYREAIEAGLKEFRAGNWPEAIRWFEAAHQADPNARTLRGLGHAHFEYRSYVRAVDYLQQALDNPRRPLTAKQRRETKKVLARARRFLVLFSVEVAPKDAEILVDGYPAEFDAEGKMLLNPGVRSVVVQHPDYYTHNQQFEVLPGAGGVLRVDLKPKAISVPEVATPQSEPTSEQVDVIADTTAYIPPKDPLDVPVGAWIMGGVGAALLTTAVVTGVHTASIHKGLTADCDDNNCSFPSAADRIQNGKNYKLATNLLLAGGFLSLAGGVTWWLIDWQVESPPETVAGFACTDDGCAASLTGTF